MKIVEVIPTLASGGAERFVVDLSNQLFKEGHDVTLLILDTPEYGSFYLNEVLDGVEVIILGKKMRYDISLLYRINKVIKKIKPDVVHTHMRALTYSYLAVLCNKDVRFYHTVHTEAAKEAGRGMDLFVRKQVFPKNKVNPIAISEESRKSFVDFYGRNLPLVSNGRMVNSDLKPNNDVREELSAYRKDKSTRLIVQVARINQIKRQDLLARVAVRLKNEGYNFSILMIGRKEDEKTYADVESLDCDRVNLLGERHNPLDYMALSDAFALTSIKEGLPISLLEAIAVGCVPVCTPVGGIINVVKDGVNGVLSKDTTEEAYYNAMKRFLSMTDEELLKMKAAAKDSFGPYGMKTCCEKYLKIFEE